MTDINIAAATPSGRWNVGLWFAQILLAALYAMAAWMHGVMSIDALAAMGAVWTAEAPLVLVRFIGLMEFLGVIGLILPGLTGIRPRVTIWAAIGLLAIQALAIPFHFFRGEYPALPFNLIYAALCVLVIWGRLSKAPFSTRA